VTRWALKLEYDGAGFVGWQRQRSGLAVQQVLEEAASRLTGGVPVSSIVAGRTDTGVHALAQVAHLDLPDQYDAERVREALNFHMKPHRICVLQAAAVDADFNARFSAIGRAYRYVILNRRARPALDEGRVWHLPRRLDDTAMHDAAQLVIGRHDFTSFRASSCQANSPLRTLDRLAVRREGDRVCIVAEARSFLHHQVRNLVGTLKLVGDGSHAPAWMGEVLARCDRGAGGPTAPAGGLFLTAVHYKSDPFA
jgi:tRNA pseudouridine38-40 synthase